MVKFTSEQQQGSHFYGCATCYTQLAYHQELISKAFRGGQGKAYLFNNADNIVLGKFEERVLLTGIHVVCDVYCKGCKNVFNIKLNKGHKLIGWKYQSAYEESQKYKEGKFVLEKECLEKIFWK